MALRHKNYGIRMLKCAPSYLTTHGEVVTLRRIASQTLNLSHSANTNDSLDSQICLIFEVTSEVVSAELIRRDEGIRD